MLTGLTIAIIGGDARQLEIIRKLTEQHADIYLAGFDQLDDGFTGTVKCKIDEISLSKNRQYHPARIGNDRRRRCFHCFFK
ncbi:dipicolinate synthase subunit DpsA [Bacillus amyloliquefaciens]